MINVDPDVSNSFAVAVPGHLRPRCCPMDGAVALYSPAKDALRGLTERSFGSAPDDVRHSAIASLARAARHLMLMRLALPQRQGKLVVVDTVNNPAKHSASTAPPCGGALM